MPVICLCDACGGEVIDNYTWIIRAKDGTEVYKLCEACSVKLKKWVETKAPL